MELLLTLAARSRLSRLGFLRDIDVDLERLGDMEDEEEDRPIFVPTPHPATHPALCPVQTGGEAVGSSQPRGGRVGFHPPALSVA